MKINLEVTLEKKSKELDLETLSEKMNKYVCSRLKSKDAILELIITGSKKIQQFNKKYRNKNAPSDVLSFPIYSNQREIKKDHHVLLGTIVLNLEQADAQAKDKNISLTSECVFLAKHSIDHLLGKHH